MCLKIMLPPQQFYLGYDIDNQNGWQTDSGEAYITRFVGQYYNWLSIETDTTISKHFDSEGNDDRYIRFEIIAEATAQLIVLSGGNTVAEVRFNANGYIDVLNNGSYVGTSQTWNYNWNEVQFVMNWDTDRYDVKWNGTTIRSSALFNANYNTLDKIEIRNGSVDWVGLDRISVSDESGHGGQINTDIYITTPCGCSTDELTGRVTVTGKLWWDELGIYELLYCPADSAINPYDINNWYVADYGWNIVDAGGVLGYWDTSRIPNGYYYVGIVAYNDLGYSENGLQVISVQLRYPNDTLVYSGWKSFAVTSYLKCNTFYHEEKPDISVQWQGQYPFELKRTYNNNRRYFSEPIRNGWTHNFQIKLFEDSSYNWEKIASGLFSGYPAYDDDQLTYGYIWVTYPDGSAKMFRHTDPTLGEDEPHYYPWPNDNSGEYIVRTSYYDWYEFTIESMRYQLYTRDGTVLTFNSGEINAGTLPPFEINYYGNRFGLITAPIQSIADRFGNTLSIGWNFNKTAVTSVSDGTRTIELDLSGGYYTQARLRAGGQTLRTVNYAWDSSNKVFTVTKTGYGVDANGVYDGITPKSYQTKYQYDTGFNLAKAAYDDSLANPTIEILYDEYGRVGQRKDYVEPGNYLLTYFDYEFYHPDPNIRTVSYLRTTADNSFRTVTTIQDKKGNLLSSRTETTDGSLTTDFDALYNDSSNPLKPTDVTEYFDEMDRRSWNDYSYYGDLIEQRVWVDDVNYAGTTFAYHPDYSFQIRHTAWKDTNKTGPKVENLSIYGNADGTENTHGKYLAKEKELLAQDSNVWAITSYQYFNNGLAKKQIDPNGFITFYEYDGNNYLKRIKVGTSDSNSPIQRFYNDSIGQRRIEASYLGGVLLLDYDGFGRMWKARKYKDPDVMTLSDAAFVPSRYEGMTAFSTIIYGYDENGNRTYQQLEAGGTIRTQYTTNGLEKRVTNDDGSYIQNYYDGRGMRMEEYRYDADSARDWWVENWFDDMDRPVVSIWYDYDDSNVVKVKSKWYYGSGKIKSLSE